MNVFPMNEYHYKSDCLKHCEKLGGRSPSVKTKREWEMLLKEVKFVNTDPLKLPERIWLSAKETLETDLGDLTTSQKELKLRKVCGETTTLENSWKTIQSRG